MSMKGKPSMEEFLSGGAAAEPAQAVAPIAQATIARRQKMAILPIPLLNDLKQRSLDESVKTGTRVTETDIIERALADYLYR